MSHIWTFSPSSEPLLQRCLEAASFQDVENEWSRKFGQKRTTLPTKAQTPEEAVAEIIETVLEHNEEEQIEVSVNYDEFFNSIDNEINLDLISKECSRNPELLQRMAEKLSKNTVQKLFNCVFAYKGLNENFLTDLFCIFLPLHIKQQYSWLCVEILCNINEKYPEIFEKLLKILIKDLDMPNQLLNNYVTTINETKVSIFMDYISNIEMSSDSFVHNILTIYTAYKDCKKTDKVQNCLKYNLLQHAKSCTADRNYGRLFLTYLQTEKSLGNKLSQDLEECLEIHHSPFKRPCVVLMKELLSS